MRFYIKEQLADFSERNFRYIKTSFHENSFTICLNRPEKRNAINPFMQKEIVFALAHAHYENSVRCIVIKAEGNVFCAGFDLNTFHGSSTEASSVPEPREEILLAEVFTELSKPCIAQVEGAVLAGGFLLIAGCDFVISTNNATYGLPEVKRGLWPMQVMGALTACLTPRQIAQMCISGKVYSAEEMLNWGLVTEMVSEEQLSETVEKLVKMICENAPLAIKNGLHALEKMYQLPAAERQKFLKSQLDSLLLSKDAHEGISAFQEKRKPQWTGE